MALLGSLRAGDAPDVAAHKFGLTYRLLREHARSDAELSAAIGIDEPIGSKAEAWIARHGMPGDPRRAMVATGGDGYTVLLVSSDTGKGHVRIVALKGWDCVVAIVREHAPALVMLAWYGASMPDAMTALEPCALAFQELPNVPIHVVHGDIMATLADPSKLTDANRLRKPPQLRQE